MVDVGEKTLETEHLACQHGLLVDQTFIGELHDHSSLLHKEEVFGNLGIIHNAFVGIEGILLAKLFSNQVQDRVWDHGEELSLLEYEIEIGLFPLGRGEVEIKRLGVDDVIEEVVFVGFQLSVLVVFVDDV